MSLTPSTMLELGTLAPDFTLPAPDGKLFSLAEKTIKKGLLVIFMCNHCPYVIHIRPQLVKKIRDYQEKGIAVVAINSNDFSSYADDSPVNMAVAAKEFHFTFPYLIDESQEVAKAYRAACTPDFYLFDKDRKLVYRGQFDSARPGNKEPITGSDLTGAIQALIEGTQISADQRPSMGCNIKWKKGGAPSYFGG